MPLRPRTERVADYDGVLQVHCDIESAKKGPKP